MPRSRSSKRFSIAEWDAREGKVATRETRVAFGIVGGSQARAALVRGNSLPGSRVSLVCNVCSRLLPKEWFAERPMASARANSRVPQPRHLCIIMLRPPLLPCTPQAAPTTGEKSVPFPPCPTPPTRHRRTLLRVPPRPRQPSPPPPFSTSSSSFSTSSSSSSSSSFSSPHPHASFLLTLLSLHTYSTARRRQHLDGNLARRRNGAREREYRRGTRKEKRERNATTSRNRVVPRKSARARS